MLTYWEILTAIQSNVPVNDSYAKLWGRKSRGGYTVTTYTGTLPAVLTGTKAGYLHRYKVYGNVGENLFDISTVTMGEYWIDDTRNTFTYHAGSRCYFIPVPANVTYTVTIFTDTLPSGTFVFRVAFTNAVPTSQSSYTGVTYLKQRINSTGGDKHFATVTNQSYNYLALQASAAVAMDIMLTEGSTPPESYIPYEECGEPTENGYKLPLTSGNTPVDIYIGDDTLSTEEYIDGGTGKIYRMVGGVLTPTDPPVPFPQIPTSTNSTTISWAGEGLAPSQVELEYEKKR